MDPSNERNWEEFQVRMSSSLPPEEKHTSTLAILPAQCLGLGLIAFVHRPVHPLSLLLQLALVHAFAMLQAEVCKKQHHYTLPGVAESLFGENWRHAVEAVLIWYTFSTMVIAQLLIVTAVITAVTDWGLMGEGRYWEVGCMLGVCVASGLISCYTTVTSMGPTALFSCVLCLVSLFSQVFHWHSGAQITHIEIEFNLLSLAPVHTLSLSMGWTWLLPFLLAEKQFGEGALTHATSWSLLALFLPALLLPTFLLPYSPVQSAPSSLSSLCLLPSLVSLSAFSLYVCRFTIKQLIGGVRVFKSPVLFYGLTLMLSMCAGILLTALPETIPQLLTTQLLGFTIVTFVCPAVCTGSKWGYVGLAAEGGLLLLG